MHWYGCKWSNGISDKDLEILISISYVSDAILDDNVDFVDSDKSNPESSQRAPIQNQLNSPVCNNFTENTQSPHKHR